MTCKTIIFDFFGVICSEVAPFWLTKYLSPSQAVTVKSTVVKAADRGELSQDDLFSALADITSIHPSRIEEEWLSYAVIDEEVVSLVRELKSKYQIGLLTNSPSPFVRGILERHHLNDLFESIVVSSENGCAKPDRAIYDLMLSRLSAKAAETIMIDDNPENISGAISAGIGGVLFRSSSQLRAAIDS